MLLLLLSWNAPLKHNGIRHSGCADPNAAAPPSRIIKRPASHDACVMTHKTSGLGAEPRTKRVTPPTDSAEELNDGGSRFRLETGRAWTLIAMRPLPSLFFKKAMFREAQAVS